MSAWSRLSSHIQRNSAPTRKPSGNRRRKRKSRTRSGGERKKLKHMLALDRSLRGNRTATRRNTPASRQDFADRRGAGWVHLMGGASHYSR
uniref:Uncharacterized protein n=1 Tax=Trichogramma kaykai TaxID=54128 RepID=A0ABD2WA22_9HYME